MATQTQTAAQFFYEHAGWAEPPGREACAQALALAERDAEDAGVTFVWEYETGIPYEDALGDHAYCTDAEQGNDHEHELWCCVAFSEEGGVLASLGAIIDPTSEYRRVIEAELAAEALA